MTEIIKLIEQGVPVSEIMEAFEQVFRMGQIEYIDRIKKGERPGDSIAEKVANINSDELIPGIGLLMSVLEERNRLAEEDFSDFEDGEPDAGDYDEECCGECCACPQNDTCESSQCWRCDMRKLCGYEDEELYPDDEEAPTDVPCQSGQEITIPQNAGMSIILLFAPPGE